MKKIAKKLTAVVVLAMMVVVGTSKCVTAEAAYCPHRYCENSVIYVTSPRNYSHEVPKYNYKTNKYEFENCYYYEQDYTYKSVCIQCYSIVDIFQKLMETHRNVRCDEYGTSEAD